MSRLHVTFYMKPTWLHALLELSRQPARSSQELAGRLGVSQQTAARWLAQLRKEGLVSKNRLYQASPAGKAYVMGFSLSQPAIKGKVFSGVGEGKYYLSKPGYKRQFPRLLGFTPYPGTLNLRLDDEQSQGASRQLRQKAGLRLEGFTEKERTYGPARCYPCRINGRIQGAIIVPERTHYPDDVVELLAPVFLRKALPARDGDGVRLDVS